MVNPAALVQFIQSDARIAGSSAQHVPSQHAEPGSSAGSGGRSGQAAPHGGKGENNKLKEQPPKCAPKKKPKVARHCSAQVVNGQYVTNKAGAKLCNFFKVTSAPGQVFAKRLLPRSMNAANAWTIVMVPLHPNRAKLSRRASEKLVAALTTLNRRHRHLRSMMCPRPA